MAIAGTEGGFNLGYPKDQGYYQAKFLSNGRYDPDWVRSPILVASIDPNLNSGVS